MTLGEYKASIGAGSIPETRLRRLLFLGAVYKKYDAAPSSRDPYYRDYGATNCRYCNAPVDEGDAEVVGDYWGHGVSFVSHKACAKPGFDRESYECQLIDADCNDCKFFKGVINGNDIRYGLCLKFKRENKGKFMRSLYFYRAIKTSEGIHMFVEDGATSKELKDITELFADSENPITVAYPNFCSNMECFEHRKSDNPPPGIVRP